MNDRLEPVHVFDSPAPQRTRELGEALGRVCEPGDAILLEGPLGSGKTCFTQGVALGLGVEAWVRSPSYVIFCRYAGKRAPLAHLDLYRLESTREAEDIGWCEDEESSVTVIEWGEKARDLHDRAIRILFEECGENDRRLVIHAVSECALSRVSQWRRSVS